MLDDFDGRIDYDTINQMPYLEAAINENLRICPPVTRLKQKKYNIYLSFLFQNKMRMSVFYGEEEVETYPKSGVYFTNISSAAFLY